MDGMAGVVPALVARHDREPLREQVHDLPLAFISPLRADDRRCSWTILTSRAGGRPRGQRRMLAQEYGHVGPTSRGARGGDGRGLLRNAFHPGEQFLSPLALSRVTREGERLLGFHHGFVRPGQPAEARATVA